MLDRPQGSTATVQGSTIDATNTATCGETNTAVFYKVVGTGHIFVASTCSERTTFPTQLSISDQCSSYYCQSSLQDLNCSNSYAAVASWLTEPNQVYAIAVGGRTADTQGNFQLSLTEKVLPPGAHCNEAVQLNVSLGSSISVSGTTLNAWNKAPCGETNKAVFYSVVGNGNAFTVTTCSEKTTFPTQISVTTDCSTWSCSSEVNDLECPGNAASKEWVAEAGVIYQVAVGGRTPEAEGDFELTLSEKILPPGAYCATPTALAAPQGTTVSVTGSTINAINPAPCGETNTAVFYSVIGTGNRFNVTTCSEVTDFATQISVASDCSPWYCSSELQDLECPTNTNAASTSWVTEQGVTYQIAVGGRTPTNQGNFELHLTEDASLQV
jgi:hypothetical protein